VRWCRSTARAAAIAPDGEALVRTHDGLRLVRTDGTAESFLDPLPPGPLRRDEVAAQPRPFAKIGASWWTARGAPTRLVPPATSPRSPGSQPHPDAAVLVGGAPQGMLLELDGAALVVSSLDAEGRLRRLARVPSPVLPSFDAVERDGGGALVVGHARSGPGLARFAIAPDGSIGPVTLGSDDARRGPVVRIAAVPGADPVLFPLLDPVPAGCVDGARLPGKLSTGPGGVVEVSILEEDGACVVGLPSWGSDGTIRVVLSRRVGPHTTLELVPAAAFVGSGSPPSAPAGAAAAPSELVAPPAARCPAEMVLVDGRVCVDRYEGAVVEGDTGRLAAPDYPVTSNLFAGALGDWATRRERGGDVLARAIPLPRPAPFQLEGVQKPRAVSRAGVLPSGYLTGLVAREVCAAAGKRLCTKEEFRTACRGEHRTQFPYGPSYREGVCNVGRAGHPAAVLHGHASIGHLDPRLGRVSLGDGPGLRPTGSLAGCVSRWGDDAIHDMVGNLDEWLDVKGGAFAGGFYARRTTSGCDAIVDNHPPSYLDYSTGVRCCATATPAD